LKKKLVEIRGFFLSRKKIFEITEIT